jgi:hypothetical protein
MLTALDGISGISGTGISGTNLGDDRISGTDGTFSAIFARPVKRYLAGSQCLPE